MPLNDPLNDFKGFQFVSISVSYCDLGVELCTQDLVKFVRSRLYQDIFFQDGRIDTATRFGGCSFIHCFVKRGRKTTYFYSQGQNRALRLLCLKLPGT